MAKNNKPNNNVLILSGEPAKDFSSYLNSEDKPFDFGLKLVGNYTANSTLYNFLSTHPDRSYAHEVLLRNINIIAQKWIKK
jgi:hypothetical protein